MSTSGSLPVLKWKRPESSPFPKIWHTFKARDIDSENLVEYRIQDLPLDRFADCHEQFAKTFMQGEPLGTPLGGSRDPYLIEDYKTLCEPVLAQRMSLACFKEGSNDIIGANLVFINTTEDNYFRDITKHYKGFVGTRTMDVFGAVFGGYNTFTSYNVDKYMSSVGLSVREEYRGRGIGAQLLASRKAICKEFGIKLTQTIFTSNFSNASADKVGYKTDMAMRYSEIVEKFPEFKELANVKSNQITLKSLVI